MLGLGGIKLDRPDWLELWPLTAGGVTMQLQGSRGARSPHRRFSVPTLPHTSQQAPQQIPEKHPALAEQREGVSHAEISSVRDNPEIQRLPSIRFHD